MISFEEVRGRLILVYEPGDAGPRWVWQRLQSENSIRISKVFRFERRDLLNEPTEAELEDLGSFTYRFAFGRADGDYHRIEGRHFGIEPEVLVSRGVTPDRRLFVAHRDISVIRRISGALGEGRDVVLGGTREDAIPMALYDRMLARFPTSTELDRYADARVADVVAEQLGAGDAARRHYEEYLDRRRGASAATLDLPAGMLENELAKFVYVRATLREWLGEDRLLSEREW